MAKEILYQQCKLRNSEGWTTDAWIESKGAVVGNKITLKDEEGLYEVIEAGSHKISEEAMTASQNFWRSHRKGTDI